MKRHTSSVIFEDLSHDTFLNNRYFDNFVEISGVGSIIKAVPVMILTRPPSIRGLFFLHLHQWIENGDMSARQLSDGRIEFSANNGVQYSFFRPDPLF